MDRSSNVIPLNPEEECSDLLEQACALADECETFGSVSAAKVWEFGDDHELSGYRVTLVVEQMAVEIEEEDEEEEECEIDDEVEETDAPLAVAPDAPAEEDDSKEPAQA